MRLRRARISVARSCFLDTTERILVLGHRIRRDMTTTLHEARIIRAPRGTKISCRGWQQEAALRMLMNNLDPEVAERPDQLIVYGGAGQTARNPEGLYALVATLTRLKNDERHLLQSRKPGVAPRSR